MLRLTGFGLLAVLVFSPVSWISAGELEPPGGPAPSMRTLQEIYEKLEELGERQEALLHVPVPRTGSTQSVESGDDGDMQRGVPLPVPRFTDNNDGTVTDNLTGLVWLRNVACLAPSGWQAAFIAVDGLKHGGCDLTDGSRATDWRLPNIRELYSLVDHGFSFPALSNAVGTEQFTEGDPFLLPEDLDFFEWWSSTRLPGGFVAVVYFGSGTISGLVGGNGLLWPVRDAH